MKLERSPKQILLKPMSSHQKLMRKITTNKFERQASVLSGPFNLRFLENRKLDRTSAVDSWVKKGKSTVKVNKHPSESFQGSAHPAMFVAFLPTSP